MYFQWGSSTYKYETWTETLKEHSESIDSFWKELEPHLHELSEVVSKKHDNRKAKDAKKIVAITKAVHEFIVRWDYDRRIWNRRENWRRTVEETREQMRNFEDIELEDEEDDW